MTRATIHFHKKGQSEPTAIVYRHCDGYPAGLGEDLQTFVAELKENVRDTRLTDASYLAAKWVVWDANNMARYSNNEEPHRLAFSSVGICLRDPGDIEYRYRVIADGKPTITHESIY